ncbi:MAG: hypothetical protein ABJB66_19705 [Gemmatimonadaceae bacterium]
MSNARVHEALSPTSFPGLELNSSSQQLSTLATPTPDVAHHLDKLAQDIIATPGAGGALLVAFASQARALALVMEAALRTQGAAALPEEVMNAVRNALHVPASVIGLDFV